MCLLDDLYVIWQTIIKRNIKTKKSTHVIYNIVRYTRQKHWVNYSKYSVIHNEFSNGWCRWCVLWSQRRDQGEKLLEDVFTVSKISKPIKIRMAYLSLFLKTFFIKDKMSKFFFPSKPTNHLKRKDVLTLSLQSDISTLGPRSDSCLVRQPFATQL